MAAATTNNTITKTIISVLVPHKIGISQLTGQDEVPETSHCLLIHYIKSKRIKWDSKKTFIHLKISCRVLVLRWKICRKLSKRSNNRDSKLLSLKFNKEVYLVARDRQIFSYLLDRHSRCVCYTVMSLLQSIYFNAAFPYHLYGFLFHSFRAPRKSI